MYTSMPSKIKIKELRSIIREELYRTLTTEEESEASRKAKELGLDYMRFGRYGKGGEVTHVSQNGKLVPKQDAKGDATTPSIQAKSGAQGGDRARVPLKKVNGPYDQGDQPQQITPKASIPDPYASTEPATDEPPEGHGWSSELPDQEEPTVDEPYPEDSIYSDYRIKQLYDLFSKQPNEKQLDKVVSLYGDDPETSIDMFNHIKKNNLLNAKYALEDRAKQEAKAYIGAAQLADYVINKLKEYSADDTYFDRNPGEDEYKHFGPDQ